MVHSGGCECSAITSVLRSEVYMGPGSGGFYYTCIDIGIKYSTVMCKKAAICTKQQEECPQTFCTLCDLQSDGTMEVLFQETRNQKIGQKTV
jgi:hypothetical protein